MVRENSGADIIVIFLINGSFGSQDQNKRHHLLDLNTLKGHGDSVMGLCFSSDGRSLATGETMSNSAVIAFMYFFLPSVFPSLLFCYREIPRIQKRRVTS